MTKGAESQKRLGAKKKLKYFESFNMCWKLGNIEFFKNKFYSYL